MDYRNVLIAELQKRRAKNMLYSQNAFARDLKLSPGRLSEILKGKQGLSAGGAKRIAEILCLPVEQQQFFIDLVRLRHARTQIEKLEAEKKVIAFMAHKPMEMESQTLNITEGDLSYITKRFQEFCLGLQEELSRNAVAKDKVIIFQMLGHKK